MPHSSDRERDEKGISRTAFIASAPGGGDGVSIHLKETFALSPSGECVRGDPQPFISVECGVDESDVIPFKTATDLIVLASGHAPGGRAAPEFEAGIEVGATRWTVRLIGERRVLYRGRGSFEFSRPTPVDKVPISFALAYGGYDQREPMPENATVERYLGFPPGMYPRNPIGLGYAIRDEPERLDGLLLPNVEHPTDRLTPENLLVVDPDHWWRQPVPWACDWFGKSWFPRVAFFGGIPDGYPDDDHEVAEVRNGWLEAGRKKFAEECQLSEMLDPRMGNAAAPALVLPFLRPGERIRLSGMTDGGDLVVALPSTPPVMQVKHGRKIRDVTPVLNRVLISTMEHGVYVVWHGFWRSPRGFDFKLPSRKGLTAMEQAGVEAIIDGQLVTPLM